MVMPYDGTLDHSWYSCLFRHFVFDPYPRCFGGGFGRTGPCPFSLYQIFAFPHEKAEKEAESGKKTEKNKENSLSEENKESG
jgi:hypothetical protein